ncbi:MAG TPA: FecR domain-containing protein [Polyangia bacterium]|nr:FecR domain-containing protein [Polyangia bacterium]
MAAIVERAGPRRRQRRLVLLTAAAVSVCGLGLFAVRRGGDRVAARVPAATLGTTIEAPAGGETITLADGSRAVLDPGSKVTLSSARAERIAMTLERGGLDLEVFPADGKPFVVVSRGYESKVSAARFRERLLENGGATVLEVEVARGRVRVSRADDGRSDAGDQLVLDAGETWSTTIDGTPPVATPLPGSAPASSAQMRPAIRNVGGEESTKDLLIRAEAFRAANDPAAAARLFNLLRVRHPSDPRAGLAAFELGRLRLDQLGDPRGAAAAFRDALSITDAPFRQDAQARLVEAYEAAGDRERCLEARATYLSRYPQGVHREKIVARCTE